MYYNSVEASSTYTTSWIKFMLRSVHIQSKQRWEQSNESFYVWKPERKWKWHCIEKSALTEIRTQSPYWLTQNIVEQIIKPVLRKF